MEPNLKTPILDSILNNTKQTEAIKEDDETVFKNFEKEMKKSYNDTSELEYENKYKKDYMIISNNINNMKTKYSNEKIKKDYDDILKDRIEEFKNKRSDIIKNIRNHNIIDETLKSMYKNLQYTGIIIKVIQQLIKEGAITKSNNDDDFDDNDSVISDITIGGVRRNKSRKIKKSKKYNRRKTKKSKKCKRRKTNRRR